MGGGSSKLGDYGLLLLGGSLGDPWKVPFPSSCPPPPADGGCSGASERPHALHLRLLVPECGGGNHWRALSLFAFVVPLAVANVIILSGLNQLPSFPSRHLTE